MLLMAGILVAPVTAFAAGISVDAGLTPAEDRWILRAQARYMSRGDDSTGMDAFMFPVVLAYGLRSDVSFFARQAFSRRERVTAGAKTTDSGFVDTFVFAKYRLYRLNTAQLTFGVAPTLGLEVPSGEAAFTSDTWDLRGGFYASLRTQTWSSDFNLAYTWNDAFGTQSSQPGNEMSADAAVGYQLSLTDTGTMTVAPTVELTFVKSWPNQQDGIDVPETEETVVFLSPGVKLATSTLIVEALARFPVHNDVGAIPMEQNMGGLFGVRLLF